MKKYPFSIRCWDSNPQTSEHESPPTTTKPGARAVCVQIFYLNSAFN